MKKAHLRLVREVTRERKDPGDPGMFLAWRILNPATGTGPYWLDEDKFVEPYIRDRVWSLRYAHNDDEHPGWRDEGVGEERPFCFQSLDKALAWFDRRQLDKVEQSGFWLALLLVEDLKVAPSGRQATFTPDRVPVTVATWRPSAGWRKPDALRKAERQVQKVLDRKRGATPVTERDLYRPVAQVRHVTDDREGVKMVLDLDGRTFQEVGPWLSA